MTSRGKKRGPQTYNGLKALLLTGGLGASMLGTRLIARTASASPEAAPAEVVEAEPTREFTLGELGPSHPDPRKRGGFWPTTPSGFEPIPLLTTTRRGFRGRRRKLPDPDSLKPLGTV